MSVRLLLVNPRYPESFWSFKWALTEILPDKRAINPPLGLATLAALCPPDWHVEIVDENVEAVPLDPRVDIVGVCGMGVQFERQSELLEYYGARGHTTVAGGSFASLCPERYAGLAHVVVAGEAEYVWKRFCADYAAGTPQPLYRECGAVDLADSPTPRFDLLRLERYTTATLQFSRGCPYLCDFCDIIVMFGRKPRFKSPEQIGRELDALRAQGARNAFFVDDNLIGNKGAAKRLLVFLADYQKRNGRPFRFGTEVSVNVAHDEELLRLLREAGFVWVFIGIETPDEASLRESRKTQNTQRDLLQSVRRLYAHGIDVLAGFILGFDNDTPETFEKQRAFIMSSGIQAAMIGLLTALPRTPLYARLEREGRLLDHPEQSDNTSLGTNVTPRNMSREALIEGYRELYRQLLSDAAIAERIRSKMRYMVLPVHGSEYSTKEQALILWRLFARGLARGGPRRLFHFLRTLPLVTPRRIPLVIADWICGLAMRDYVERRFGLHTRPQRAQQLAAAVREALAPSIGDARVSFSLAGAPRVEISFTMPHLIDRRVLRRSARRLERLLAETSSTLVLRIGHLHDREHRHMERFLARLARYGDRVHVAVDERMRVLIGVDWSRFHRMLSAPAA
jgi:radical SAM superfamily enzyme YgiQ (UPF0313 family)